MARIVGLDIGSTAVRAVEIETRRRRPVVRRSGRVALPPGTVEGGQIQSPAEVTKALRRLWHENRFTTKTVRLAVGSGSVLARQVELDWMPAQDLRKAMRYLVADLLPVPIDEANIDHLVLEELERPPEVVGGDPRRMVRVLLVATAREGVDAAVRCVQAAGLRPLSADLSPLALVRTASMIAESSEETELLVDIGADKVSIAVHTHGHPRFVRVIPGLGGDSLTRALDESEDFGPGYAEALKRTAYVGDVGGIPRFSLADLSGQSADGSLPAVDPSRPPAMPSSAAHQRLQDAAQHIADEVSDTLAFYIASDPGHAPTHVRLTGRGGEVAGFDALCARTLGLPVQHLLGTGAERDSRSATHEPDLAVSIGLCLGVPA